MKSKSLLLLPAVLFTILQFSSCKKGGNWVPDPPFLGLEKSLVSIHIPSGCDTTIVLPGGSIISYSDGTFVYSDGLPVSGSFEILYREFHDAVDIFLAGIPMDFYSLGQRRTMQTAGMFQIDARQDGQKLMIAKGKKIDITFNSKYQGSDFSFFFLNPNSGQWEWVDLPESEVNAEKVKARLDLANRAPKLFMGDEFFVLNYDRFMDVYLNDDYDRIYRLRNDKTTRKKLEDYKVIINNYYAEGELVFGRAYYHPAEMLWKDKDGKPFPKWLNKFEVEWKKSDSGKWYTANFNFKSFGNNEYEITYIKGKQKFTKRMEAIIPLKNLLKLPASEWQKNYDKAMEELALEQSRIDLMAETFRSFSVNQLGIFNFDVLLKLDDWFEIDPTFTISDSPVNSGNVIIILGDNSGYIKLSPSQFNTMRINPLSKHRIFMMLSNNEVGYYPIEKLKEINLETLTSQANAPFTFELEKHVVIDEVELREFLGFN